MTVYLLGTYALKSKNLINKNKIINLLRFRTSNEYVKKRRPINNYSFSIIVDSNDDLENLSKSEMELPENANNSSNVNDPFLEIYNDSLKRDDIIWIPAVIYSEKWLPPANIREINQSLYIMQPCWDIYESSSKTIKTIKDKFN